MIHAPDASFNLMPGLPDPERDSQFYAGVQSRRLVAWAVDVTVILLVGVPLALVIGVMTLGIGFAIFPLILMGVGFVYRIITIANRSATWGMRIMGIELRRHDGTRFDLGTAVMHTAIYTFCIGVVLLQLASMLCMATTRFGQGVPDFMLRTTMINRPVD
jgi:uncharacterized RDD family membrane protein YckC